jgi:hypothetical protein
MNVLSVPIAFERFQEVYLVAQGSNQETFLVVGYEIRGADVLYIIKCGTVEVYCYEQEITTEKIY